MKHLYSPTDQGVITKEAFWFIKGMGNFVKNAKPLLKELSTTAAVPSFAQGANPPPCHPELPPCHPEQSEGSSD